MDILSSITILIWIGFRLRYIYGNGGTIRSEKGSLRWCLSLRGWEFNHLEIDLIFSLLYRWTDK